jgi:hypothetical protein
MNIDTSEQAFPSSGGRYWSGKSGMTLRDWFAGQALAGPVSSRVALYSAQEIATIGGADWMARGAYNIADAMLKAREAKS